MNNASISFPLNVRIGTEQIKSDDPGIYCVEPNGSSWLKFLLVTLQILLTILLVFYLFYKIVVSFLTKYVTEPLIK